MVVVVVVMMLSREFAAYLQHSRAVTQFASSRWMASLAWNCSEQGPSPHNVQLGGCAHGSRVLHHAPIHRAAILPFKLNLMSLPDQPMDSRKRCPTRCISWENVNAWYILQINHWPPWTGQDVSACCALIPQNTSRADRKLTQLFCKYSHRTADIPLETNLNKLYEAWLRRLCVVPLASLLFFLHVWRVRDEAFIRLCPLRQEAGGSRRISGDGAAVSKPNTPSSRFEQKKKKSAIWYTPLGTKRTRWLGTLWGGTFSFMSSSSLSTLTRRASNRKMPLKEITAW